MTRATGQHDPKVLAAIAASFDICLTGGNSDVPGQPVSVADLHVGHVLQAAARTREGVPIAPAGARVTPILLEKLRNFAELHELSEPLLVLA